MPSSSSTVASSRLNPTGSNAPVIPFTPPTPIALGRRLFQIGVAVAAEKLEPEGLIPLEFGMIITIHDFPEGDQNTLGARMSLDRTTVSALLFELEKKGLVERQVNDTDRRARILRLSRKGRALHDRLRPITSAAQQRILSVLSASERKAFIDMLTRVIEANRNYLRLGAGRRRAMRPATKAVNKGRS